MVLRHSRRWIVSALAIAAVLSVHVVTRAATYDLVVVDKPPSVELTLYGFNDLSATEMDGIAWDFEWTTEPTHGEPPRWTAAPPTGGPFHGLRLKIPMSAFPKAGQYRARARS